MDIETTCLLGPGPCPSPHLPKEPHGRGVRASREGLGVGGGRRQCVTSECRNQIRSELPTHSLKSLYTLASKILFFFFLRRKKMLNCTPFHKGMGALVSHSGGNATSRALCLRRPAQLRGHQPPWRSCVEGWRSGEPAARQWLPVGAGPCSGAPPCFLRALSGVRLGIGPWLRLGPG